MQLHNITMLCLSLSMGLLFAEQPIPTSAEIYEQSSKLRQVPDANCFLGLLACKQCACTMDGMTGKIPQKACWLAEHLRQVGKDGAHQASEKPVYHLTGTYGTGKNRIAKKMVEQAGSDIVYGDADIGMWLLHGMGLPFREFAKQVKETVDAKGARQGIIVVDCAEYLFAKTDDKEHQEQVEAFYQAVDENDSITWILLTSETKTMDKRHKEYLKDNTVTLSVPDQERRAALFDEFEKKAPVRFSDELRQRLINASKGYPVSSIENFFQDLHMHDKQFLHEAKLMEILKSWKR